MSIQPKPKSTERALRVQLAVLFSSFDVDNFKIAASSTAFVGFSCRYSSKILLNSFVALFVLLLSFSESNVKISSSFNDGNRLKPFCLLFKNI